MNTEIEDLHRVVKRPSSCGGKVVVGGHSLGGSITTAYATWDFKGKPGASGLSGLVYIDGGSGPTPITADEATEALAALRAGRPVAHVRRHRARRSPGCSTPPARWRCCTAPNEASLGWDWPLLPANLKPPVLPTNLALTR